MGAEPRLYTREDGWEPYALWGMGIAARDIDGDGRFLEGGEAAGIASLHRGRGAALVDLNLDGHLDLAVVNRRAKMELWQNTGSTGNWLLVNLEGPAHNSRAIGAFIELDLGDRTVFREVTLGGGHAGGPAGDEHFGLGTVDQIRLRVIWPDGQTGKWQDVRANQRLTVTY